jgi:hypothetical protein
MTPSNFLHFDFPAESIECQAYQGQKISNEGNQDRSLPESRRVVLIDGTQ